MVEVAPSMAQAASMALPPRANIIAPALAARGLPVIAAQWRAVQYGLACVLGAGVSAAQEARDEAQDGQKRVEARE
jgi:hypothetical protein